MKKNAYVLSVILLLFCATFVYGQKNYPKREFRGVWIASVMNIDWPSRAGLSVEQQKQEYIDLLEMHKNDGLNAVIVQVRPSADAFYDSKHEPWSQWLTGKQGKAPEPFYDPLVFMIDEAHKRNLEFHAWCNPFRAVVNVERTERTENHLTKTHPEWFVQYGRNMYFDPGMPEAREHVTKVIKDIVKRYDVDGVHFDDYFYPYKIKDVDFPDTASYTRYNIARIDSIMQADSTFTTDTVYHFDDIGDWRRNNVNLTIKMLHDAIKSVKPYVKFGISPFGIWRNKGEDPRGSETNGYTNYDGLYADILTWLENDWLDYIAPQVYWQIGHPAADYETIVKWWTKNSYNKHLYIGEAIYRINSKIPEWQEPNQMPRHIRLTRSLPEIQGNIYFSAKSFKKNPLGIVDSMRQDLYQYPALVPQMKWIDSIPPATPKAEISRKKWTQVTVSWEKPSENSDVLNKPLYYVVYRFEGKETGSIDKPSNIYAVLKKPQLKIERKWWTIFRKKYTFVFTAVDRLHNESKPGEGMVIKMR